MTQARRSRRIIFAGWMIALLLLIIVGAVSILAPGQALLRLDLAGGQLAFTADRQMIFGPGDCVFLSWQVSGIREIYLNDIPTIGQGSQTLCLAEGQKPVLRVVLADGSTAEYELDIRFFVDSPLALLLITLAVTFTVIAGALAFAAGGSSSPAGVATSSAAAPRSRGSRILSGVGAVTLALLVLLAALELMLRFYFSTFGTQEQRISYLYSREEVASLNPYALALPQIEYGLSPLRPGHNRLGYRGPEVAIPKPEGTFRIIAMGASTTYGYTPDGETYPAWLERTLRETYGYEQVEVVNAGVFGYNTWNTFINFSLRILELEPDLVIIYHATNDVLPRETDPDCYRGVNPLRGLNPLGENWSDYNRGTFSFSTLYRVASIALGVEISPLEFAAATSAANVSCGGTSSDRAANVRTNRPDYFERNLRNLIAVAQMNEVPLMFSTWAYYEATTEAPDYWREAIVEHNAILTQLASDYGLLWVDYAPLAPQGIEFWSDYIHMNSAGSRHQAETYAEYIAAQGLIDR